MQFKLDVREIKNAAGDSQQVTGWEVRLLDPTTKADFIDPGDKTPILPVPRQWVAADSNGQVFPLPAEATYSLPQRISDSGLGNFYDALMQHASAEGDVAIFGRYLFDLLLGEATWQAIDAIANHEPVELALNFPASATPLHRLPWETMYSGSPHLPFTWESFLAGNPDVAITRRVTGSTDTLSELPSPPRVLFVVGASLGDEFIRPGAEYLGLLRSLAQSNLPLYTHLLLEANPDSLEAAVGNFRPNIVHFTCHGVTGADNLPALSLQAKTTASGTIEVNADQLCELLRTAKNLPLPQVVVLNACSTATSQQNEIGPPLVAELVKKGIPVVVGMAGDVADMACRLFTRGFYRALLEGEEIALAAARGRRAAIAYGGYNPANTLDWGLPALCLSDGVGEARLQLHVQDERLKRLQQASEFSIRPNFPAFCDRLDMMQVYDQLMRSSEKQYLVISVSQADQTNPNETRPQFGRTRLLKEMAAQAVRDGHVPVLLSTHWLDQPGWPDQIAGFYGMVIQAVNKTLRILRGIPGLETLAWSGARLRYLMAPGAAPPASLGQEFSDSLLGDPQGQGTLAGAVAMRLDLMELLSAVRQKLPAEEAAAARLLLLIDDLHQVKYIENILAILDLDGLRDPTVNTDVRGIFTYSNRPVIGQETSIKKIDYWINAGYVHLVTFKQLHGELTSDKPDEFHRAAMVYRHFLLHWQVNGVEQRLALAPPLSNTPAAVVVKGLANLVKGYPSNLDDLMVRVKIESYREINDQVLRPADDEAALKNLQDNLRKR